MELHCNGCIIQKNKEGLYKGVEGDNWFLNYENMVDKEIVEYFDKHIDLAFLDDEYVDVSNEIVYLMKYIEIAKNKNIQCRLILCYTSRENPKMNDHDLPTTFLGYDFAYSGGSYYSAVANDVISKRIPIFTKYKLNINGLFETLEEISEFVVERNKCMGSPMEYDIENGDFIIYKLYEMSSV